jgi:chitinase
MNFISVIALFFTAVLAENISRDEFNTAGLAYSAAGVGPFTTVPSQAQYDAYMKIVGPAGMSKEEQAWFLANLCWESGGFTKLKEEGECQKGTCPYGNYYGRGYIQLSWKDNYQKAGAALFPNEPDRYVKNPDLVAQQEDAWRTARWFWESVVVPALGTGKAALKSGNFGASVKAINGAIECGGNSATSNAGKRLNILKKIRADWKLPGTEPTLAGC